MATGKPRPASPQQRPAPGRLLRGLLSPWAALLLGCACFFNSLPNDLVFDDEERVARNVQIRSLANFGGIWLSDWAKPGPDEPAYVNPNRDLLYRPFTVFTFAVNYALHGIWPPGFRALNVLLHGLSCLLVWQLTQRLFGDRAISSCAALLFAVHPIHCEAVVYIVGRAEQLVVVFLLLGLLALLPRSGVAGPRRALLAALLFFLALLSKESAVCYIPIALIVLYAKRAGIPGIRRGGWLTHAGLLLLPFLVYLPLRYVALEYHLTRGKPFSMLNPLFNADALGRIVGAFTVLGHYTRLFLWPSRLSVDYGLAVIDPQAGPNTMTWLGVAGTVGLLVGLAGYLRRAATWQNVATLCAMWLASYFLVSNTLMLIGTAAAERLMYLPSVPILMLLALAGTTLWSKASGAVRLGAGLQRVGGVTLGLLLLAVLSVRGVARNADWATSIHLFTRDAATYPQSALINGNAALDCYLQAMRSDDETERRRNLERADAYYARALSIFPAHWGFLSHRAEILFRLGDLDGAISQAKRALQLNPGDPVLLTTLGRYLHLRGQPLEALPYLEEAVRRAPDELGCLALLGETLLAANRPQRAIPVLARVADGDRSNWQVRRLLAAALLTQRDPRGALRYAREACELKPDDVASQVALAEALLANGQRRDALELFGRVRDALPADHPLRPQIEERMRSRSNVPEQPGLDTP